MYCCLLIFICLISSSESRISHWGTPTRWGHRRLTQALFGGNVCENERIGSNWGAAPPYPPMIREKKSQMRFRYLCLPTPFYLVVNTLNVTYVEIIWLLSDPSICFQHCAFKRFISLPGYLEGNKIRLTCTVEIKVSIYLESRHHRIS